MKVKDVMMGTPYFCNGENNLGVAAELMWKGNCGFLPVVDEVGDGVRRGNRSRYLHCALHAEREGE